MNPSLRAAPRTRAALGQSVPEGSIYTIRVLEQLWKLHNRVLAAEAARISGVPPTQAGRMRMDARKPTGRRQTPMGCADADGARATGRMQASWAGFDRCPQMNPLLACTTGQIARDHRSPQYKTPAAAELRQRLGRGSMLRLTHIDRVGDHVQHNRITSCCAPPYGRLACVVLPNTT